MGKKFTPVLARAAPAAAPPAAAPAKEGAPLPTAKSAGVTPVKSKSKLSVQTEEPVPAPVPAPAPADAPADESQKEESPAPPALEAPKSPNGAYGLRQEEEEEEKKKEEKEVLQPKKRKAKGAPILPAAQKKRAVERAEEADEDEVEEKDALPTKVKAPKKRPAAKKIEEEEEEEVEEEEEEAEAAQPKKRKAKSAPILPAAKKKRAVEPAEEADEDEVDEKDALPTKVKTPKKRLAEKIDGDEGAPLTKAPLIKAKVQKKRPAEKEADEEDEEDTPLKAPLIKKAKQTLASFSRRTGVSVSTLDEERDEESEVRGVCRHCKKNVTTDQDRLKESEAPFGYLHKACSHRYVEKKYPHIPAEQIDTAMIMGKQVSLKEDAPKAAQPKKFLPGASVLLPPKIKKIKVAKVKSTIQVKKRQHRDKGSAESDDDNDDDDDFEKRAPKKQAKAPKQEKKEKKEKSDVKKPLGAYMLFSNEHREDVKANNPGFSFGDVAKAIGQMWRDADESDKEPFLHQARDLKIEHDLLHPKEEKEKAPKEHKHKGKEAKKDKVKGPKPPPNAFMLFAAEARPQIKIDHPDFGMPETSTALSEIWKAIEPDKKKVFVLKAQELKDEWTAKAKDGEGAEESVKTKKVKAKKEGATSEPPGEKAGKVKVKLGGLFTKKPKPAPKADAAEGDGKAAEEQHAILEAPQGAGDADQQPEEATVPDVWDEEAAPPAEEDRAAAVEGGKPLPVEAGAEAMEEDAAPDDAVAAAMLLLSGDLDARADEGGGGDAEMLLEGEGAGEGEAAVQKF